MYIIEKGAATFVQANPNENDYDYEDKAPKYALVLTAQHSRFKIIVHKRKVADRHGRFEVFAVDKDWPECDDNGLTVLHQVGHEVVALIDAAFTALAKHLFTLN